MKTDASSSLIRGVLLLALVVFIGCNPGVKSRLHASRVVPDASLLGTKAPYRFADTSYAPPPPGYVPVFINYAGRHGARFMTDSKDISLLTGVLSAAEKQGDLTSDGMKLSRMLERLVKIEAGHYGYITLSGEREQEGIGRRLRQRYPGVFRGNGLRITTTRKVRTQQSARAFLGGLGPYPADRIKERILPDSLNDALRFFDISPGYRKYKKGPAVRSRMDSLLRDPRTKTALRDIGQELFTGDFLKELVAQRITVSGGSTKRIGLQDFVDNLYGTYAIQFSMRLEEERMSLPADSLNFAAFFQPADLRWLAFVDGAEEFLEKGPAYDTLGIQVRDAAPLLVDFIETTDDYIRHPDSIDADLRFAHAETISPFATLLGIRIASSPSPSIFTYDKYWQPSKIIPLSANICWILYENHGRYLLKVTLNEKDTGLPVKTSFYPYYRWKDVRRYYLHKLASIHAGLDEDMHRYLLNLK